MPSSGFVPPNLDLDRTVIVLTHPRTGSSLLMQTLRLLGVEPVGDFTRPDLPAEANPRGFYENSELLVHGLHASALVKNPALLRERAVKISLPGLAERRSDHEWAALSQPTVIRLLPIRTPVESMSSEDALLKSAQLLTPGSLRGIASVRDYLISYGYLASRLASAEPGCPPPVCIDYRLAIDDPAGYVDLVAAASRLNSTPDQRAAARANVDRSLYRVHRAAAVVQLPEAARLSRLEEIYRLLPGESPDKWSQVLSLLPSWTRLHRAPESPPPTPR